jgi:hypothetical protein
LSVCSFNPCAPLVSCMKSWMFLYEVLNRCMKSWMLLKISVVMYTDINDNVLKNHLWLSPPKVYSVWIIPFCKVIISWTVKFYSKIHAKIFAPLFEFWLFPRSVFFKESCKVPSTYPNPAQTQAHPVHSE